jgi:hypothetical protein
VKTVNTKEEYIVKLKDHRAKHVDLEFAYHRAFKAHNISDLHQ